MGQAGHADAGVVFCDDADVVLDDTLAEVQPAGVRFGFFALFRRGGKDVGGAEVGAKFLGDDGPTHEFGYGEEFEELLFEGDEGVAGVRVDAVEEVGLFVVVGGEDDVVDYSLENLWNVFLLDEGRVGRGIKGRNVRRGVLQGYSQRIRYRGLGGSACRLRGIYRHAWLG